MPVVSILNSPVSEIHTQYLMSCSRLFTTPHLPVHGTSPGRIGCSRGWAGAGSADGEVPPGAAASLLLHLPLCLPSPRPSPSPTATELGYWRNPSGEEEGEREGRRDCSSNGTLPSLCSAVH